ncbi:hypothetical protein AVEN_32192-1, partial [Araneus ventricosus]
AEHSTRDHSKQAKWRGSTPENSNFQTTHLGGSLTDVPFKRISEEFWKISVAQKLKLKLEPAVNKIYGFGNQKMPALTSIGRIKADIEVDNVKAKSISIYVVPDDAQSDDLIIGRT